MSVQSWQIPCPRCGWANSGANVRCGKCGQPLAQRPGMLVAGQSQSARSQERPVLAKMAIPGGFLPRLIAWIIDTFILGAVFLPIQALWQAQLAPTTVQAGANTQLDALQRSASLYLALTLLQVFYFAGSWTVLGATPGQLLMSLRVTDAKAGGIGFFRGLLRYVMMSLTILFFPLAILSALMIAVGKQKRGVHDLLAGTYIIQIVDNNPAADSVLPPAFDTKSAIAPGAAAPAPAPPPAPAPAAVAGAAGAAAFGVAQAEPPAPATDFVPAPPAGAIEFPPPPLTAAPAAAPDPYSPPEAAPPATAAPDDQDLYAPPAMVDPTASPEDFNPPAAPAAEEREVYSPSPGQISDRAVRSAELYSAAESSPTPDLAPAETTAEAEPGPAPAPESPPVSEGELPPIEFPPMAPPPSEPKKK